MMHILPPFFIKTEFSHCLAAERGSDARPCSFISIGNKGGMRNSIFFTVRARWLWSVPSWDWLNEREVLKPS
jgi:hypothetical protein